MVAKIIIGTLKTIASALLTEAVIKRLVIWGLKKLSESSENKVDDELVAMIEKAVYNPEEFAKDNEPKKEEEKK